MLKVSQYMGIAAAMADCGWGRGHRQRPLCRKKRDRAKIRKRKMVKMSRKRNR